MRDDATPSPLPMHAAPYALAVFAQVVETHQHGLHAFLRGMVGNPEQARDLVQDTLQIAWQAARTGAPPFVAQSAPDDIRRWLYHTAYCRGISALRRRKLLRWESLELFGTTDPPAANAGFEDQIAEGEALRAALTRLAPQDAACLLLRVVHGFSAAEVAAIVGATAEVVHKRLSRARQRLRAAYLAEESAEAPVEERARP